MRAGGGGRADVASKTVAAGLLGLQLLGMPIAVVARQAASGVALPRLELAMTEASGKAPRTTEEEMIGAGCFMLTTPPGLSLVDVSYLFYRRYLTQQGCYH